jgi:hypothetical protein
VKQGKGNAQRISSDCSKLWNYCNVLPDAGLSYGDYIEQLTYLLFLKMADERKQLQPDRAPHITEAYEWSDLVKLEGDALEIQYRKTLETLGREKGMLGTIFRKAQNKIQNLALLHRLVADLIDREEWTILPGGSMAGTDSPFGCILSACGRHSERLGLGNASGRGGCSVSFPLGSASVEMSSDEPEATNDVTSSIYTSGCQRGRSVSGNSDTI